MKKCIFACIFVLFGCFACTQATKTMVLKPGMPNTLKLSNGEVVYDLSGEWDMTSNTTHRGSFVGVLEIEQDEDRFVGTLKSGDYLTMGEKVRGNMKGAEVVNLQVNTNRGWLTSTGEILDGGKVMDIMTFFQGDAGSMTSTLRKK